MTEEHVLDEGLRQNPREEVSLVDISKLLKKEFRVVIIKMTKKLREKKDEQNEKLEVLNKELENINTTKQR